MSINCNLKDMFLKNFQKYNLSDFFTENKQKQHLIYFINNILLKIIEN